MRFPCSAAKRLQRVRFNLCHREGRSPGRPTRRSRAVCGFESSKAFDGEALPRLVRRPGDLIFLHIFSSFFAWRCDSPCSSARFPASLAITSAIRAGHCVSAIRRFSPLVRKTLSHSALSLRLLWPASFATTSTISSGITSLAGFWLCVSSWLSCLSCKSLTASTLSIAASLVRGRGSRRGIRPGLLRGRRG